MPTGDAYSSGQLVLSLCSTCWDQSFSELVVILPDYALRISLGTFSSLLHSTCIMLYLVFRPQPMKPEGTIGLHSVILSVTLLFCLSLCPSVCHTSFPDFLAMISHIWMKLGSTLPYGSYTSISTFVTIDLLIHELLTVFRTFLGYVFTYLNGSW